MNDRAWSDTLRMVIEMLSSTLPDVTVADRMPPPGELDQQLPYVMVDLLPVRGLSRGVGVGPFGILLRWTLTCSRRRGCWLTPLVF